MNYQVKNIYDESGTNETNKDVIVKVSDFTLIPGDRYIWQGASSGEEFRDKYLVPAFKKAIHQNVKLIVDIDGTIGYGPSFLEEAFGGLTRVFGKQNVRMRLKIKSEEYDYYIKDISRYIENCQ